MANKKLTTSLVASFLLATNLYSNELSEITVYSATKSEQSIQDVTSNVEVITKEELEEKHINTLVDALKLSNGISVSQSGGIGQQTSFFLRGFDTESTLVLINGVEYNDPTTIGGQAQLDHMMIADVEKIEIIKGAQSGIYGANASAGVINIITKKASDELSINTNIEYGSYNTKKYGMSISKKIDDFSFYLGGNRITTDGFTAKATKGTNPDDYEDDGYENTTVNANVEYEITDNDKISAGYTYINADVDYDGATQSGHTIEQTNKIFNTAYQHNFNANNYSKIYYTNAKFLKIDDTGFTPRFEGKNEDIGIDNKVSYFNNTSFILFGGNKKKSTDDINSREQDAKGVYITNNNKYKDFVFTQTLRKDFYDGFDNKVTGKLGVKYNVSKDLSFSANYGTSYKIPSLYELSFVSTLEPEEVKGFDLGIEYKNFTLTYFNNKMENEILYSSTLFTYYNSTLDSDLKGVEIEYNQALTDDILLSLDYTYYDAKDENGYQLAKRPKFTFGIGIDYYGIKDFHFNINTQYVGKRVEYTWGTNNVSAQTGKYAVTNTAVNYTINKDTKAYLKLNNIFDKEYQVVNGYATEGRSVYVGVNYKF